MPPYRWASITRRRWFVRRERAVAARSSIALPQSSTRDMPDRRKGEEPATTLLRDHGMLLTTVRRRKSSKVSLVSRVYGNLITLSYLDWSSLPSLCSPRPHAFAVWYTFRYFSGGAAVETGRSV